jgi:phosphoheptose isomerase
MPYKAVDLSRVKTYPLPQRQNRVNLEDLVLPTSPYQPIENTELHEVSERITAARLAGRPVIWMMGAHVVKRGLSPLIIDLLKRGVVTHVASNGATTIHDFEIAFQGHTSEDVAKSLADGSFGMAEETGAMMNLAIRQGARLGMGLGEAVGRWMAENQSSFPYRELSIVYNAYRLGIPYTVHVAIGPDIIHQHPLADFAATGWATGQDFKVFTAAVCDLEGGVYCNFGSAVIGPEVFLKALSIARNLGNPVKVFTTANFDLIDLGDYRKPIGDDQTDYYYRPRKNIVNRPVMLGGRGFHIVGDHLVTIPNLYHQVVSALEVGDIHLPGQLPEDEVEPLSGFTAESPAAARILTGMVERYPDLAVTAVDLMAAFRTCLRCFTTGGTLFIGGNGGSMADAIHIGGELEKSFKLPRRIPAAYRQRLSNKPGGEELANHLQQGLRTVVLGLNPALSSAIDNDSAMPHTGLAQELYVLCRPGDVFLGISTSGKAANVNYAADVAYASGLSVIALTGQEGIPLASKADIAIRAPDLETAAIQNYHVILYHTLCEMLEVQAFGGDPNQ